MVRLTPFTGLPVFSCSFEELQLSEILRFHSEPGVKAGQEVMFCGNLVHRPSRRESGIARGVLATQLTFPEAGRTAPGRHCVLRPCP